MDVLEANRSRFSVAPRDTAYPSRVSHLQMREGKSKRKVITHQCSSRSGVGLATSVLLASPCSCPPFVQPHCSVSIKVFYQDHASALSHIPSLRCLWSSATRRAAMARASLSMAALTTALEIRRAPTIHLRLPSRVQNSRASAIVGPMGSLTSSAMKSSRSSCTIPQQPTD